jgi:hypothetical protein
MPKRSRDDDEFSSADSFDMFHSSASTISFSDCDLNWAFDSTDPTHLQFPDFGASEIDYHTLNPLLSEVNVHNAFSDKDLFGSYQSSNGGSLSVPSGTSTPSGSSSALYMCSSASSTSSPPLFPVGLESLLQSGHPNLCRSLRGSETCLTAALRIMTTLHVAHSECLSAHHETVAFLRAKKMETVLSTNKDVLAGMSPILACSCSSESLVQLLLSSICGNLIAWNSAMISAECGGLPDYYGDRPFSSAGSTSGSAGPPSQARVLPQPITIGQHQIDGSLGRAIHAQVMAGELRVLEGLVESLARRFSESSRADETSPTSQPKNMNGSTPQTNPSEGLSSVVHRHIVASLRARLQNTRANIFTRLGSGV